MAAILLRRKLAIDPIWAMPVRFSRCDEEPLHLCESSAHRMTKPLTLKRRVLRAFSEVSMDMTISADGLFMKLYGHVLDPGY